MKSKEYFFLLDLKKPNSEDSNDKIEFINKEDKDNVPKCFQTKEENDKIIKIFKFSSKLIKDNKASFEFDFDGKKYKLSLEKINDKTFLFDSTLEMSYKKLETKIDLPEIMNYFYDALNTKNENQKLTDLFNDSINLCNKRPNFNFLINIFVKVYNKEFCSKLLDVFNNKIERFVEKIDKENLRSYNSDLEQIYENREEIISKFSLNKTYFYGLILCYFNNCDNEKYRELFDILSKSDESKKILFDIMLKYKLFFKKQIDISKDLLNEIIKFTTKKDFKTFKEDALFYLKDINTFLEIIENNKDDIIDMKGFDPIKIPEIKDDEIINFGIINSKIESITNFSNEKKKSINYFKWPILEKFGKKMLWNK
jgi:hypothetical protein